MHPEPPAAGPRTPARREHARKWLAAAAIFAAGALAAGLPAGLLSSGSSPGGSPTPSTAPSSTGGGQVSVNASCVNAISDAQEVRDQLRELGLAAQQLNAGKLDQIVRQLEPVQNRLDADARACQIVTHLPGGTPVTSRPSAPASSASPTP